MSKPFYVEKKKQWMYSNHCQSMRGFNTFLKRFTLKVNEIKWPGFDLVYFEVVVHQYSHFVTGTSIWLTHTHTHTNTKTHTNTHSHTYMSPTLTVSLSKHTRKHTRTYTHTHICVRVCLRMCLERETVSVRHREKEWEREGGGSLLLLLLL